MSHRIEVPYQVGTYVKQVQAYRPGDADTITPDPQASYNIYRIHSFTQDADFLIQARLVSLVEGDYSNYVTMEELKTYFEPHTLTPSQLVRTMTKEEKDEVLRQLFGALLVENHAVEHIIRHSDGKHTQISPPAWRALNDVRNKYRLTWTRKADVIG